MTLRKAEASDAAWDSVTLMPGEDDKAGGSAGNKGAMVKRVGSRTFYRVKDRWIDADYDEKVETKKVEVFSEEYFELIRKHKELARCFALGEQVIVVVDVKAYETVPAQDD